MKSKKWIALLLIAALAVAAMSVNAFAADGAESQSESAGGKSAGAAGRSGEKHREKIAEPDGAIGRDKAKETALADAGPDAGAAEKIRVRVAVTEDGTVCYKVSFTAGEQRYSYRIDALTGEILKKTAGSAAEHEAAKPECKKREKIAEPEGAIGRDKAKETALADAGTDAGAAEKIRVRVAVTEDGTVCYKVSFTAGEQRYSYRIDALTGEILKKTAGSAAEHEAAKPEHGAEGGKSDGSGSRRGRNGSGRAGEAGSAGKTAESASETDGAL